MVRVGVLVFKFKSGSTSTEFCLYTWQYNQDAVCRIYVFCVCLGFLVFLAKQSVISFLLKTCKTMDAVYSVNQATQIKSVPCNSKTSEIDNAAFDVNLAPHQCSFFFLFFLVVSTPQQNRSSFLCKSGNTLCSLLCKFVGRRQAFTSV